MPPIETRQRLARKDVILYALGVGESSLPFVYEEGLKTLPTMTATFAYPGFIWRDLELGVDWRRVLHGETGVTLHTTLPVEGELIGRTRFGPIFDKGQDKGAVVYQTREITLADGTHIASVRNATILRSEGGFGGSSEGQPRPQAMPDRVPDEVVLLSTAQNQALIYRLSGDLNPLHVDPSVAQGAGFAKPILHGLATYGVVGRALLSALCDNEPARLKAVDGRFSAPVFPGETIRTEIWHEGRGTAIFRAIAQPREQIVLNNGRVEFT